MVGVNAEPSFRFRSERDASVVIVSEDLRWRVKVIDRVRDQIILHKAGRVVADNIPAVAAKGNRCSEPGNKVVGVIAVSTDIQVLFQWRIPIPQIAVAYTTGDATESIYAFTQ